MSKHKISFSMKSNFSFDRVITTFSKEKIYQKNLDIYTENLNTYDGVQDLLELWTPDLVVLDSRLEELERIEYLVTEHKIPIITFDSDYEVLAEQVRFHFKIEIDEDDENESADITYIADTEQKEKIIVQDRIIEKEVIRTEFTAMNSKIVVVASMWQGAGSTTLGINLARSIAERGLDVAYVEYPLSKPYMFDYLSIPMEEENGERKEKYIDVSQEIKHEGKRLNKKRQWKKDGVNWFVTDTRKEPLQSFSYEEMLQFVYSINSVVTIVDVSHNLHEPSIQSFLSHADNIFVSIEPDPVKIDWLSTIKDEGRVVENQRPENQAISFLNEIDKNEDTSYDFVTMKYTNNINREEWIPSLEKEPIAFIPALPYKDLIYSVWSSTFIYDDEQYNEEIEKSLYPLITRILPRNLYGLKTKKKRSLINLFKKEKKDDE